jgi:DNA primase
MNDLDEIKQKVDIVTLISEYVALKKTGANFKGLCPFHNEKTPSFVVSPERQIWHCFGGCNDGGDIFKFLMRIENIEFPEALKILADKAGVKLTSSPAKNKTSEIRERIFQMNKITSEFYTFILTNHPTGERARKYLAERKISENSVKLFGIGYAPNAWETLRNFLTKKGFSPAEMEAAGLVSKSAIGHDFDRFRGRVMFTLRNHRGEVVGFAGRLMDPQAKEAKYVNTSETLVYIKGDQLFGIDTAKDEIKKAGFVVVVEGEIDAISSYQAGVRNVVAIKGSALTAGQVALLKRYTENVYLSLDTDFAGDAAAHRGIEIADSAGLTIKVVSFTQAKDPDELIKLDPKLWHQAIKEAVPFYDYVIDSSLKKYDPHSPIDARRIVSEIAKFIVPIENLVVKSHYVKKLAKILDMGEETLETQLQKDWRKNVFQTTSGRPVVESEKPTTRSRIQVIEEYLLSIILQSNNPSDYLILIAPRLSGEDFSDPVLGKIYQLLWSIVSNPKSDVAIPHQNFDIKQFAKLIPEELLPAFDRLYLSEINLDFGNDQDILSEVQKTAWEIKELSLREKLRKISDRMKSDQESDDLTEQFSEITRAIQRLRDERGLISAPS